jgi:hypothetical protein
LSRRIKSTQNKLNEAEDKENKLAGEEEEKQANNTVETNTEDRRLESRLQLLEQLLDMFYFSNMDDQTRIDEFASELTSVLPELHNFDIDLTLSLSRLLLRACYRINTYQSFIDSRSNASIGFSVPFKEMNRILEKYRATQEDIALFSRLHVSKTRAVVYRSHLTRPLVEKLAEFSRNRLNMKAGATCERVKLAEMASELESLGEGVIDQFSKNVNVEFLNFQNSIAAIESRFAYTPDSSNSNKSIAITDEEIELVSRRRSFFLQLEVNFLLTFSEALEKFRESSSSSSSGSSSSIGKEREECERYIHSLVGHVKSDVMYDAECRVNIRARVFYRNLMLRPSEFSISWFDDRAVEALEFCFPSTNRTSVDSKTHMDRLMAPLITEENPNELHSLHVKLFFVLPLISSRVVSREFAETHVTRMLERLMTRSTSRTKAAEVDNMTRVWLVRLTMLLLTHYKQKSKWNEEIGELVGERLFTRCVMLLASAEQELLTQQIDQDLFDKTARLVKVRVAL